MTDFEKKRKKGLTAEDIVLSAQIKQLAEEASAWAECKADEEADK